MNSLSSCRIIPGHRESLGCSIIPVIENPWVAV